MRLNRYNNQEFDRGRSRLVEVLWVLMQAFFVDSWIPGSAHRVFLLRLFGATIGLGVVLKPRLRVKFPWRLGIGDHVWLGEGVWIDNLAPVVIGNHVCISQGAYLCTGSHDWTALGFDLNVKPISVADHVWVCAKAIIGPGVSIGQGSVLALGGVAVRNLSAWGLFAGVPAEFVAHREIKGA